MEAKLCSKGLSSRSKDETLLASASEGWTPRPVGLGPFLPSRPTEAMVMELDVELLLLTDMRGG